MSEQRHDGLGPLFLLVALIALGVFLQGCAHAPKGHCPVAVMEVKQHNGGFIAPKNKALPARR